MQFKSTMKSICYTTKKKALADGFNFAGSTTDETMVSEIARDYKGQGYEIVFVRGFNHEQFTITYWTKRKESN